MYDHKTLATLLIKHKGALQPCPARNDAIKQLAAGGADEGHCKVLRYDARRLLIELECDILAIRQALGE